MIYIYMIILVRKEVNLVDLGLFFQLLFIF
jgi:hypothetical protein